MAQSDDYITEFNNIIYSKKVDYKAPPIELLKGVDSVQHCEDTQKNSDTLEQLFIEYKVPAKVISVITGPTFTRYEVLPDKDAKLNKLLKLAPDIAYILKSRGNVRIEPIVGKNTIGVEVPNEQYELVSLKSLIESDNFANSITPLPALIGKNVMGESVIGNIRKMPHLLIAGSTGSGKSNFLFSLIAGLMYKSSPEDVRLLLIDPKKVELALFANMPHMLIKDVISDVELAKNALNWAVNEMENRYTLLASEHLRSIEEYNSSEKVCNGTLKKLPYIVIIIDEYGDIMFESNRKYIEERIVRITQKSRAAGIHIVLTTQRCAINVISSSIKACIQSRIAMAVPTNVSSRMILDDDGAETLLGRGDLLYAPIEYEKPERVQAAYVSMSQMSDIIDYVKSNNESAFYDEVDKIINRIDIESEDSFDNADPLLSKATKLALETGRIFGMQIQRNFQISFARAMKILDQMEKLHLIGPCTSNQPREIYITKEIYENLFGKDGTLPVIIPKAYDNEIIKMHLAEQPFRQIACRAKTLEVRLSDEKRRTLKLGDKICFCLEGSKEKLEANVVALHFYGSFNAIFSSEDLMSKAGFTDVTSQEATEYMYRYYTKEEESEYGVVGIEIELIE